MDDRLVIGIRREDNIVSGRVLNMPERFRGKGILAEFKYGLISALYSAAYPELSRNSLLICGAMRELDDLEFHRHYATENITKQVVANIRMLVRMVNITEPTREITNEEFDEVIQ